MRTLLFCDGSPAPGFKRGLAPERIVNLGGRARRRSPDAKRFLFPGSPGGGGEGESKDPLERSSFRADANIRVGLRQRNRQESGKSAGARDCARLGLWKVAPNEDKFSRTSTRKPPAFSTVQPVSHCRCGG